MAANRSRVSASPDLEAILLRKPCQNLDSQDRHQENRKTNGSTVPFRDPIEDPETEEMKKEIMFIKSNLGARFFKVSQSLNTIVSIGILPGLLIG